VLLLDASLITRAVSPRPSLVSGRKVFTYSGEMMTGIAHFRKHLLLVARTHVAMVYHERWLLEQQLEHV
jgi:hypothetical protein